MNHIQVQRVSSRTGIYAAEPKSEVHTAWASAFTDEKGGYQAHAILMEKNGSKCINDRARRV